MLRQARSKTSDRNPQLHALPRAGAEGNIRWGMRAAQAMALDDPAQWTYIALLGGSDTLAFRLRIAQAQLRRDMLPSYWSEAILVDVRDATMETARAIHVPLVQPEGPYFATRDNGVVSRPLADFNDRRRFPNIALIALPVGPDDILARMDAFKSARSTLDALEHVVRWLAFAWGVARTGNPLLENYGIPSACMLETVCAAARFDLTPGLEARAACPEAIWSAATHWHDYFEQAHGKMPLGRYWAPHVYEVLEPRPTGAPHGSANAAPPPPPTNPST